MTLDQAKTMMETTMRMARTDIANNDLCTYMRGYYIGNLAAYANAGGVELLPLYERYRAEVRHALQVAA